jgi:predicted Zn-dependent protease
MFTQFIRRNLHAFLLMTLLGVFVGGCAVNPVTGSREVVLLSVEDEKEIGFKESRKIDQNIGFVEKGKAPQYVKTLGQRLAQNSPRKDIKYEFHIVDMAEPNAFALPGGYVFVTRGLLALVNSEDELANVVGHEIGHVAARHAVQRVSKGAPLRILTGIPALAVGIVLPGVGRGIAGLGEVTNKLLLAPYGRSQEHQADDVGQQIAASSGYDPAGMPRFLRGLDEVTILRQKGKTRRSGWFDSHPATPDRVEQTKNRAKKLRRVPSAPIAQSHADFLSRLDGLRVGKNPGEGVFVDGRFLHPDLNLHLRFPKGWKTQNTRAAVLAIAPDERSMVALQLAWKREDPTEAAEVFENQTGIRLRETPRQLKINGLRAAQSSAVHRGTALDLTWIGYGGVTYQVTGVTSSSELKNRRRTFQDAARSFRPLTKAERAEVLDTRLRIIQAREGETVAQLVARVKGVWSPEETAAANSLKAGDSLRGGQPVKVPVQEVYRSAKRR